MARFENGKVSLPHGLQTRLNDVEHGLRLARIEKMMPLKELRWLEKHSKRFRNALRAYHRQCANAGPQKAQSSMRRILKSFSARVVSVAKIVISDDRYESCSRYDLTQARLTRLAEKLDLFSKLDGFARLIAQQKCDGTKRPTLSFSGNVRAAQFLVACVLSAQDIVNTLDSAQNGQGIIGAIDSIKTGMRDGYNHWLSFDLAHNFPSVTCQHLDWLVLPKEVISSVVFPNGYINIIGIDGVELLKMAVRQGLPQGASVSGLIASALIGRKLENALSGDYRCGSYVDDVGIGARSLSQIDKLAQAIRDSFENDSAGPLLFSKFEKSHATHGVEFCGRTIKRALLPKESGKCSVWCDPNIKSFNRFQRRAKEKLKVCSPETDKFELMDDYAKGWCISFGIYDDARIEEYRAIAATFVDDDLAISVAGKAPTCCPKTAFWDSP